MSEWICMVAESCHQTSEGIGLMASIPTAAEREALILPDIKIHSE